VGFSLGFLLGFLRVLCLGFGWVTYVYFLVYLEALALFLIYTTLFIKKKEVFASFLQVLHSVKSETRV
jgi:hypothetical protein